MKGKVFSKIFYFLISAILLCLFLISKSYATELGLFVSEKDLLITAEQRAYTYVKNPLYVGGKFFYNKDSDKKAIVGNFWMGVKNTYNRSFNIGLGFQGLLGEVKKTRYLTGQTIKQDYDVFAVGFRLTGVWKKEALNMLIGVPLSFDFEVFYSPEILSFSDAKRVFSFKTGGYYYVTSNAAFGVCYKYYKISLNNTDWENSAILLGIKINFY